MIPPSISDRRARWTVDSETRAMRPRVATDWQEFSPSLLAASATASNTSRSDPATSVASSHTHEVACTLMR
jgi:hypothetical protein